MGFFQNLSTKGEAGHNLAASYRNKSQSFVVKHLLRQNKESASTLCGTIVCLAVCAMICFIAYRLLPQPETPRRLWSPVVVGTDGKETILGDTRQLEFWTPSTATEDYLHQDNGAVSAVERWEVLSNDEPLVQFGMLLHSNQNILGYRRVEVYGQGHTSYKPGWWWTVNVFTNYSAGQLADVYQSYWKSAHPVFIEVIDNRGRTE